MLARTDDDSISASALMSLRERIGGEVREGKLYPIAPALTACIRPEFEGAPLSRRTYLVHVAPQQETRVFSALRDAGIDSYLPTEPKSVRVNAVRRRVVSRPMMPGYLFPIFDEHRDHWECIPSIEGVVRLFMINMRPWPIPDYEIQRVHDREVEAKIRGKGRRHARGPFKIADVVQINDYGPWHGFFGRVEELLDAKQRIKVWIDVFGRQTPVEVSVNQVRAV